MLSRCVDPQLNNFLLPGNCLNIIGWPLAVDDTHTRIHPLRTSGIHCAVMPATIAMMNTTLKNKSDRRKSAMRMRSYTTMIGLNMFWRFDVGMVQQQKWINLLNGLRWQRLTNMHSTHIRLFCI